MLQPVDINVWDSISGSKQPRWWMGAWLNYRKFATVGYVPNPDVRALMAGYYPFDYVFDFPAIAAGDTADDRIVTQSDFYILARMGNSSIGAEANVVTFNAQLYIDLGDGYQTADRVINQLNFVGSAQHPHWFRTPFFVPAKTPILCRVQNFDLTQPNTVQITLHGAGR